MKLRIAVPLRQSLNTIYMYTLKLTSIEITYLSVDQGVL